MQQKPQEQEIIQAAYVLFKRYGLAKTTMEEIGLSMGRGKKYVYYYFKNKEQIFEQVIIAQTRRIAECISKEVRKEALYADKVRKFFEVRLSEMLKIVKANPLIKYEAPAYRARIREVIKEANQPFAELLADLLKKGVENGEFTAITVKECPEIAKSGTALLLAAELYLIFEGKLQDGRLGTGRLVQIFTQGLSTRK